MPVSRKEVVAPGSDEQLLSLAAEGDFSAFEQLIRKIEKPLTQYAHRLGASSVAIENCLTMTVERLADHLDRLPLPGRLGLWVFQVARSTLLKGVPSAQDPDSPLESEPDLEGGSPPDSIRQRFAPRVRAALLSLPVPHREAIVLKVFHGLSYQDIARITGTPPATVYYWIHISLAGISRRL